MFNENVNSARVRIMSLVRSVRYVYISIYATSFPREKLAAQCRFFAMQTDTNDTNLKEEKKYEELLCHFQI